MRHNQGQNQKRTRGRGRRSNNHGQTNFNRNTTFDSNGPDGRLRGNALQLFEKYTALAHDANAAERLQSCVLPVHIAERLLHSMARSDAGSCRRALTAAA